MKTKRAYTMGARAEAVQETRRRIMQATFDLAHIQPIAAISLDAVAVGAEVSVQTILRQFASRAGLIAASIDYAKTVISEERLVPVGDVDEAVRVVIDHYEQRGDLALLLLAQEQDPDAAPVVASARGTHESWVRAAFAPMLADAADPKELFDLLVTATDVYTWKLLRRDRRRSRRVTEARMRRLVEAVLIPPEP
ncbi:hypothetical protein AAFP30_05940 [Gordonia sp. CPCC 205515]|uniref:TetR/AcrR family transcriptional regulator n=1 Tax=Gordonia sp. CPCC 205515 TaxID=3140791 RepID=UPI003AF3E806